MTIRLRVLACGAVRRTVRADRSIRTPLASVASIPLDDLPAERIWGEFEKLLLQAERPSIGFALARELGVIHQLLPEMEPLYDCPQDPEWHPEGNVWIHTLMVIDKARELNGDLDRPRLATIMLGAVCHDLGKPATTAVIDGRVRSPNHEAMGVAPATQILDRLNINTLDGFDVRAQVLGLVTEHLRPMAFYKARDTVTDGAFRRLAQKVDLELLARFAAIGLPRPHRHVRLLRHRLVPRARPLARRRAQAAGADPARAAFDRARRRARSARWERF